MKLLFDQNLSRVLVRQLADRFPASAHVTDAGLENAIDATVWAHAHEVGHVLVTKDRDFERSAEFPGPPPKCILITLGNASTAEVEQLIRQATVEIEVFEHDTHRLMLLP